MAIIVEDNFSSFVFCTSLFESASASSKKECFVFVLFFCLGHGGSLYFGLTKEGHVKGIKGNRDERDKFRLGLDEMMNKTLNPPVLHTQLEVIYIPVSQTFGNSHPVLCIDLFVIG